MEFVIFSFFNGLLEFVIFSFLNALFQFEFVIFSFFNGLFDESVPVEAVENENVGKCVHRDGDSRSHPNSFDAQIVLKAEDVCKRNANHTVGDRGDPGTTFLYARGADGCRSNTLGSVEEHEHHEDTPG